MTIYLNGKKIPERRDDDVPDRYGSSNDVYLNWETADSDAHYLGLALTGASRNFIISEDRDIDWGHPTSTNPTFFIHSSTSGLADRRQYGNLTHNQSNLIYSIGTGVHIFQADALQANSTMTFTANPTTDGGVVFTVRNTTLTGRTGVPGAGEFQFGATTEETCDNIVTALNDAADGHTSHRNGTTVVIEADVAGTAGNSYVTTETTDTDNVYSFSGATMSGGRAAVTGTPDRSPTCAYFPGSIEIDNTTNFDGTSIFRSTSVYSDDIQLTLGSSSDVRLFFETADANANAFIIGLPDGDATNVPVVVIGDQGVPDIVNADLGLFDGITDPSIAILDQSNADYLRFYHDGTNPYITTNAGDVTVLRSSSADESLIGFISDVQSTGALTAGSRSLTSFSASATYNLAANTLNSRYGYYVSNMTITDGAVNNQYGIYLESLSGATANYGIYSDSNSHYFTFGAANSITFDAGTTDHSGSNVLYMDLDVNSASVSGFEFDIDVGTALNATETVNGISIDIDGLAGDDATSRMNAIYLNSANTTGGVNTGLTVAGAWDLGVWVQDNILFAFGNAPDGSLAYNTTQDPDAMFLGLCNNSRALIIAPHDQRSYNFAHAIETNPTIFIHSANPSTTEWGSLAHDQTDFVISSGTGEINLKPVSGSGVTVTQSAGSSGIPTALTVIGGAHTGLTAATEDIGINFNLSASKTWVAGAGPLAAQREILIQAPTYVGDAGVPLTITDASTVCITGSPIAGANMTLTHTYALLVDSGISRFDGQVQLGDLPLLGITPDSNYVLHLGTSIAGGGIRVTGTDAGASGVNITLEHMSASPADGDVIGAINFNGQDSVAADTTYSHISAEIQDATDGSEESILRFYVREGAGVDTEYMRLDGTDGITNITVSKNISTAADVDIDMSAGGKLSGGGVQFNQQSLAADTNLTLDENDSVVSVTTGAVSDNTITLPPCSGNEGMLISIYLATDGGMNAVVTRNGTDVIQNGSADLNNTSVTLDDAGDFVQLLCVNSSMWQVVVNNGGVVV
jgi:hypothetical protein